MSVAVTGNDLTRDEVVRVARGDERVELPADSVERMHAARAVLDAAVERGDAVYGVTTGVASRRRARVSRDQIADFNRMLLRSHLIGQGADAPRDVVRAAMLRLANGFASGSSGVRPEVAERLVAALNEGESPRVRLVGSIGLGDLAPNADLAYALFADFPLAAGEAVWLVNSNSFSTGFAALAVADTERLLGTMHVSGALAFEGFLGNVAHLHAHVVRTRPSPGMHKAHARLIKLLEDSALWEDGVARNLQDPLTFRGLPQVLATLHDALEFADAQLAIELNAASWNPLVVVSEQRVIPASNVDPIALVAALDLLRIALATAITAANERVMKLLQRPFTGLTDGLAAAPDVHEDGLAELGNSSHAMTVEARLLAQPVSFELASTTQAEGIEDRTTMAPLAARRLAEMVAFGERIVALELVVSAQAVEMRNGHRLGKGTQRTFQRVRQIVPFTSAGTTLPPDLEPITELVRAGMT